MHSVVLKNIKKNFGSTQVIKGVDIEVKDGEFLVLVGPSGCGKSTLLRMIAGLEEVSSGEIYIGGKKVNGVDPKDRDIAMVFQNYALYPHMSVFENMAFGLRMRKVGDAEVQKRVKEAADLLQLSHLLERKPKELSGGQRQRVALGRAIVRKSKVFLFDEPLSNLDAKLRNQMRVEIKKLHKILGNTMIYVTHDQVEATTMGDRIVVLEAGHLQQLDSPQDLYGHPKNKFVAGFIGVPEMNFIDGEFKDRPDGLSFDFEGGELVLHSEASELKKHIGKAVTLGVRPEFLSLEGEKGDASIEGKVELVENLGSQNLVHVAVGKEILRVTCSYEKHVEIDSTVRILFNLTKMYFFDKNGESIWPPRA